MYKVFQVHQQTVKGVPIEGHLDIARINAFQQEFGLNKGVWGPSVCRGYFSSWSFLPCVSSARFAIHFVNGYVLLQNAGQVL